MIGVVVKRDGREDIFNPQKISQAIRKAFFATDGEVTSGSENIITRITKQNSELDTDKISVE